MKYAIFYHARRVLMFMTEIELLIIQMYAMNGLILFTPAQYMPALIGVLAFAQTLRIHLRHMLAYYQVLDAIKDGVFNAMARLSSAFYMPNSNISSF